MLARPGRLRRTAVKTLGNPKPAAKTLGNLAAKTVGKPETKLVVVLAAKAMSKPKPVVAPTAKTLGKPKMGALNPNPKHH